MIDQRLENLPFEFYSAVQHGVGEPQLRELQLVTPSTFIDDWEDVSTMMTVGIERGGHWGSHQMVGSRRHFEK